MEGGDRSRLRRLQDTGVSASKRGRQLPCLFLDQARNTKKIFSPLAPRHFRPDSFVSASSRFYREIDILFISGTDLGQFLFGGWIDGVEIFAGLWGYEPAVNEKLIAI